ncbi:hypothetical protein V6N12_042993 [Hibiscus sabdariffa]|uniref:Uncharacterized protein n=1 Tax=Hibiscus sabdariffa TaxID=183260 RepID=A0ABR2DJJ3_9ROSI
MVLFLQKLFQAVMQGFLSQIVHIVMMQGFLSQIVHIVMMQRLHNSLYCYLLEVLILLALKSPLYSNLCISLQFLFLLQGLLEIGIFLST